MQNPGGIERPFDARDFQLGSVQAPVAIPASYIPDISWLVRNPQGQTPACGAHAASHLQAILEHNFDSTTAQRYTPRFSWIRIKTFDGFPLEAGTDMRSIFKSLVSDGAADFEPLENDVNLPLATYSEVSAITPAMTADAATKKVNSYAFGGTSFQQLCQAIYQNKAVLMLIKVDDGFWGSETPTFTTPTYGHFVCAYGYDPTGIYIVDSADANIGFKKIAKQYITSTFIIESGTAIDLPPAQVKAIIQQSVTVAQDVAVSTLPAQQKINVITVILNFLKSFFPKVGSSPSPMTSKPWYASKTLWFNGITVLIAAATFFGFTINQDLFNNVTTFLVSISPVVNIALRLVTKQPIAIPATTTQ